MNNGICLGVAVGIITGALLVNNCSKVRCIVDETQNAVKAKLQKKQEKVLSGNNFEAGEDMTDLELDEGMN